MTIFQLFYQLAFKVGYDYAVEAMKLKSPPYSNCRVIKSLISRYSIFGRLVRPTILVLLAILDLLK